MATCSQCGKNFSTVYSLNRHIAEVHCHTSRKNTRPSIDHEQAGSQLEDVVAVQTGGGGHPQDDPEITDGSHEYDGSDVSNESDGSGGSDVSRGSDGSETADDGSTGRDMEVSSHDEGTDSEHESDDTHRCSDDEFSSEDESLTSTGEGDLSDDTHDEEYVGDEGLSSETPSSLYGGFGHWGDEDEHYTYWISRTKTPYVVRHRPWLAKINRTPSKLWKHLISEATRSQLDTFREIAANVLHGGVPMHPPALKTLDRNKWLLRVIASEKTSYSTLRRTLLKAQRHHLLSILLLHALPSCIKSRHSIFV